VDEIGFQQRVKRVTEKDTVTVTIAICTHNRAGLLRECLSALKKQLAEFPSFQVLVVDNGCTDETQQVMGEFAGQFSNWLGVKEKKLGLSHARNRALDCADGDWVAFLDDDARVLPGYASCLEGLVRNDEFDCVGGVYLPWYQQGRRNWFRDSYASNKETIQIFGELPAGRNASGGNCLFKKRVALAAGGFNASLGMVGRRRVFGEETRLQIEMRRRGARIGGNPDWLVEHLVPISKQSITKILALAWRVGRDHWVSFDEHPTGKLIIGRIRRLVTRPLVGLYQESGCDAPRYWQNIVLAFAKPLVMTLGELVEAVRLRLVSQD